MKFRFVMTKDQSVLLSNREVRTHSSHPGRGSSILCSLPYTGAVEPVGFDVPPTMSHIIFQRF